jgi:hypothetical protein
VLKEYVEYFYETPSSPGPETANSRQQRGAPGDRLHPVSSGGGWANQRLLSRSGVSGLAHLVTTPTIESRHWSHEVRQNFSPRLRFGLLCPDNSLEPILARPRTELAHHGSILGRYGTGSSCTLRSTIIRDRTRASFTAMVDPEWTHHLCTG